MDIPALVILFSFIVSICIVLLLRFFKVERLQALTIQLFSISTIWLCVTLLGEFVFPWAGNATCSIYLGCVEGFAGYDAFEHLFFGIAAALAIVWLSQRFPEYSILHSEAWKTALTVIATIALIAVLWEMLECAHDALRLNLLHEPLRNIRLHINLLDQPTNLDTMGDLTFSLVGSVIGFFLLYIRGTDVSSRTRR